MRLKQRWTTIAAVGVTVLLVLAGCSGEATTTTTAATAASTVPQTETSQQAPDAGQGSAASPFPPVAFDAGALSTDALPIEHVQVPARFDGVAPPQVTPVIDTCAALATTTFDAIASEVADQYGFGSNDVFAATPVGAACDYRADTHLVRVIVGSPEQVAPATGSPAMWLPPGAGDLSVEPWSGDSRVNIVSEDGFGIPTAFGAHAATGTFGIMVLNIGGTGVDDSFEGVLFARLAAAVADQAQAAPAPDAAALETANTIVADPCAVWTTDELNLFLTENTIDPEFSTIIADGCVWSSNNAEVRLRIKPATDPIPSGVSPIAADPRIYNGATVSGSVYLITGDIHAQIQMNVARNGSDPEFDTTTASIALAQNILARLG